MSKTKWILGGIAALTATGAGILLARRAKAEKLTLPPGDYEHIPPEYIRPLPGCTDPTAENYNPLAQINDGSCVYPPIVPSYQIYIHIRDIATAQAIAGATVVVDGIEHTADQGGATTTRLSPGLHEVTVEAEGYNTRTSTFTVEATRVLLLNMSAVRIYGCTEPAAINFDPLANMDDGSCQYPLPPPPPVCTGTDYIVITGGGDFYQIIYYSQLGQFMYTVVNGGGKPYTLAWLNEMLGYGEITQHQYECAIAQLEVLP